MPLFLDFVQTNLFAYLFGAYVLATPLVALALFGFLVSRFRVPTVLSLGWIFISPLLAIAATTVSLVQSSSADAANSNHNFELLGLWLAASIVGCGCALFSSACFGIAQSVASAIRPGPTPRFNVNGLAAAVLIPLVSLLLGLLTNTYSLLLVSLLVGGLFLVGAVRGTRKLAAVEAVAAGHVALGLHGFFIFAFSGLIQRYVSYAAAYAAVMHYDGPDKSALLHEAMGSSFESQAVFALLAVITLLLGFASGSNGLPTFTSKRSVASVLLILLVLILAFMPSLVGLDLYFTRLSV